MADHEVPVANIPPFGLRMQPDLKARVEEEAKRSGRSINAEIVYRLKRSLEADDTARINLYSDYKTIISIPEDTKNRIEASALENRRDFNSEILFTLEKEYPDVHPIGDMEAAMEAAIKRATENGNRRSIAELQDVMFKAMAILRKDYDESSSR